VEAVVEVATLVNGRLSRGEELFSHFCRLSRLTMTDEQLSASDSVFADSGSYGHGRA